MRDFAPLRAAFALCLLVFALPARSADPAPPWEGAAFSADPKAMLAAALALSPPAEGVAVDLLLEAHRVAYDAEGRRTTTVRLVFRPLTAEAAMEWTLSASWAATSRRCSCARWRRSASCRRRRHIFTDSSSGSSSTPSNWRVVYEVGPGLRYWLHPQFALGASAGLRGDLQFFDNNGSSNSYSLNSIFTGLDVSGVF